MSSPHISRLNDCFLRFGYNPDENINRLTEFIGEELGAFCALYGRLDGEVMCSSGLWYVRPDLDPMDHSDGRICFDVITENIDGVQLVRDLPHSSYAQTDPNVKRLDLQTYVGIGVKLRGHCIGSLCVLYQADHVPTPEDEKLLSIVASAVAIEEERKRAGEALLESETRYRALAENLNVGVYRNTVGPKGRFIEANPAIIRMFGFDTKEEFFAMNVADLYENPDDRKEFNHKMLRHGFVSDEELRLSKRTGEIFIGSVSAVAVRGDDGEVKYFDGIIDDITVRKRMEAALEISERQYRSTLDSMGDAIHVVDADLRFVLFNRRFKKWNEELGLETNVIGRSLSEIFPFLSRGVFDEYDHVFNTGKTLVTEERTVVAGKHLITETRKIPVFEGDRVARIVTAVRDVTEQQRAHDALIESEERYRGLFENATDLVCAFDREGRFTNVSRSAERLIGFANTELIGVIFLNHIVRRDRRRVVRAVQRVFETGEPLRDFPVEVIVKDGSRKQFEMSIGPQRKGKTIIGVVGSARDVTARKEAEEALRQSEERFREMAELLPEIVCEIDAQGMLTYVNQQGFAMTGYTQEDFEKGFFVVDLFVPEAREIVKHNMDRVLSGEWVEMHEYLAQRKDGSVFPIIVHVAPIIQDGQRVGLRGIVIDISGRIRLEEQLRHAVKMEAVGQLAGGIAHDFNNLLTGILGHANMLKLRVEPGSFAYDAAKTMEGAAERAVELTKQMLGFARRGKHQILPVDLHRTIYDVVTLLSRTIDKSIRISVQLDARNATIMGDPGQLEQILVNLAINARDAMPRGGDLVFRTESMSLDSDFCGMHMMETPGEYLVITVKDTGSGIPAEIRDRIFEPFFTTKTKGEGTGMGLAMVYGIVKNHGGTIQVQSEGSNGATFQVYLPLTEELPIEQGDRGNDTVVHGTGRILVVDDEEIVRTTILEMLQVLGYQAVGVSGGEEAVEYYRVHGSRIDLILIDLVMPGMGGRECFRHLREIDPKVCAVLTTGYGMDGKVQEIIDEGMQGFLQKPYRLKDLGTKLHEAMLGPTERQPAG